MPAILNAGFRGTDRLSRHKDRSLARSSVMTAAAVHPLPVHADPRERRKHLRKGTLWHGTLRTPDGNLACNVLNLSARGAKVEVAGVAKGQSVTLVMEP